MFACTCNTIRFTKSSSQYSDTTYIMKLTQDHLRIFARSFKDLLRTRKSTEVIFNNLLYK